MNNLKISQVKRLVHNFWQIAKLYFYSDQKWKARSLILLTTVLMLGFNAFGIVKSYVIRDLMTAVTNKDVTTFYQMWFQLIGVFVIFVPIFVFWHYSQDLLQLHWRKWLTKDFIRKYLSNRSYYKLKSNELIDNPDQRIAEDIDTFIRSSIDISGLFVVNIVSIFSFLGILFSIDKFLTFLAIALALLQTIIAIFIGGRLSKLKFKQLEFQANFRYGLIHIRDNSESIAFYRGENQELATIQERFSYVIHNFYKIINLDKNLNFFTTGTGFVITNLPIIFLAPRFFAGEIEFGEIGQA
ncbi:MAG: SbmA/BacA-like family transporter, partial [Microcoleaceae cyanobacterium MO_207.B10]|nr:SbmA/BacA-like family transporter [Microcoleaceae cyanobacterium MO_207.B10]